MTWAAPPDTPAHIARLFDVLRLIVHEPGIAFEDLRARLSKPCGSSTLHKDLKILKTMELLDDRRHRDGYYVSATSFSIGETRQLMQGLRTLGKNLRHPLARKLFDTLTQRLGPIAEEDGPWGYPMMTMGDRVIVDTLDDGLQDIIEQVAECILTGQSIHLFTQGSPWGTKPAKVPVYPLQFRFHQIAWYLVAERFDGAFAAFRLDRIERRIQHADLPKRKLSDQLKAIDRMRSRMRYGWGVQIPPDDTDLVEVAARFLPTKAGFIREGDRRHPTQRIDTQPDGSVIYHVTLHTQALPHFADWLLGFGDQVEALTPSDLRTLIAAKVGGYAAMYPEADRDRPPPCAG